MKPFDTAVILHDSMFIQSPISFELQYLSETIPNKYAVTDKADGDRFLLFITSESKVYLLNNNVTYLGNYKYLINIHIKYAYIN